MSENAAKPQAGKIVMLTINAVCFGGMVVMICLGAVNLATILLAIGTGLSTLGLSIQVAKTKQGQA
jgi:hypothetical protein